MSSIFEEYQSVLGKSCKKNALCPSRLLASTVIFNKLWAKLYSQYLCAFLVQVIHETNDKTVTCSEAIILSTSFENTTCQGIRHTTMVLPFKIKLKKDCTKNASVVRLCSISEVVKPSSKMTLLYSKIVAMWHVQVKSPTHYFGSF